MRSDGLSPNLEQALMNFSTNSTHVKNLLLELARRLDETNELEQRYVCRKIKEILKDKIAEGKITEKWIEETLPPEYKRKYTKSELHSLSRNDDKEKILVEYAGIGSFESDSDRLRS